MKHFTIIVLAALFLSACNKNDSFKNETIRQELKRKADSIRATLPKSIRGNKDGTTIIYRNGKTEINSNTDTSKIKIEVSLNRPGNKFTSAPQRYRKLSDLADVGLGYVGTTQTYVHCYANYISMCPMIIAIDHMWVMCHPTNMETNDGTYTTTTNAAIVGEYNLFDPFPPVGWTLLSWNCEINYRVTITHNVTSESFTFTDQAAFNHEAGLTCNGLVNY
uniref:hypothetical protein n=1 Tax=Pedobacter schmidteae TaxID=2201271 RepID=UPI000EAC5AAB|nr:hypothetical protein [Pedobacter schmidteae]